MRRWKENLTSSSESLEYITPCIASIVGVDPTGNFCEALACDGTDDADPFPAILASSLANLFVRDELSVGFELDVSCINNSSDILSKIDSEKNQNPKPKKNPKTAPHDIFPSGEAFPKMRALSVPVDCSTTDRERKRNSGGGERVFWEKIGDGGSFYAKIKITTFTGGDTNEVRLWRREVKMQEFVYIEKCDSYDLYKLS